MVGLILHLEIPESSLGLWDERIYLSLQNQVWQKVAYPVVAGNQPSHPHYHLLTLNHSPENPGCGSLFGEVESSTDSPEVSIADADRIESTIC